MRRILAAFTALCDLCGIIYRKAQKKRTERAERAIVEGDREAVNEDFKKLLRVLLISSVFPFCGCSSYVVVSAETEMKPIVHEGVAGWFVPNAQMLKIRERLAK